MARKPSTPKSVETLKHDEDKRKNIPTAEFQSVLQKEEQNTVRVAYKRAAAGDSEEKLNRNRDLDPQLVWRGKDEQDWSDLVVHAPPLYIQAKKLAEVLAPEQAEARPALFMKPANKRAEDGELERARRGAVVLPNFVDEQSG